MYVCVCVHCLYDFAGYHFHFAVILYSKFWVQISATFPFQISLKKILI